jgi:hypothetical protein
MRVFSRSWTQPASCDVLANAVEALAYCVTARIRAMAALNRKLSDGVTPSEPDSAGRRRRLKSRMTMAAVAVLVPVAFLGARGELAARDRSKVYVVTSPAGFECDGTTVKDEPLYIGNGNFTIRTAEIHPNMHCRFRFMVLNRGGEGLELERIALSLLGPDGDTAVELVGLAPHPLVGYSADDEPGLETRPMQAHRDAIFKLDVSLPADSASEFVLSLKYRADGCTAEGTRMWFSDQPIVTVRSRGVKGQRSLVGVPFAIRGNELSNSGPGCHPRPHG